MAVGGALLSAPVAVGAALAIGAGYLIYRGWKAYADRQDLFQQMRLAQYGVRINDKEQGGKVLALEAEVMKKVTFDQMGQPVIGTLPFPELISGFGFGPESRKSTLDWITWFERRFKPVFLRNLTEFNRRAPGKSMAKVMQDLPDGLKPAYARATKIDADASSSPYYVQAAPFQNQTSVVGTGTVEATIVAIEKAYAAAATLHKTTEGQKVAQQKSTIAAQKVESPLGPTINRPMLNQLPPGMVKSKLDNYYGAGERGTLGVITGDKAKDDIIAKNNRIDDLTTIRMKAYGLTTLDKVYVNVLLKLEKDMLIDIDYGGNGQATYAGDPGTAYVLHGPKFGLSRADADARAIWDLWFQKRFLPVYLNFLAQSKKVDPNSDPFTGWMRFKADELLKIANFINDAGSTVNGQRVSIWSINASPFAGERAGMDPAVIQPNLDAIKMSLQKDKYDESQAAARAVQAKYTGQPTGDVSRKVNNALSSKARDLMGDLAKATGNSNYRTQDVAIGNYAKNAGFSTSFESAGTGYGGGSGASVKLSGSAKQHAESMMAAAKAAGLSGSELALFMGQVSHESGNFIYNKEIADGSAYEGRRDLGNVNPGDGTRYRGRGWIQITGRANYAKYGKMIGLDLVNHPELAEIPENAEKLALAYWMDRVRPFAAKRGGLNLINVSRAVNGNVQVPNGMDDREEKTNYWMDVVTNGKDVGLSNKGAVEKPGATVTAPTGQEVTPPVAKPAGGSGGQEVTPSLPTTAVGSSPANSGPSLAGPRSSAITMVPQANPSSEVDEHRRLATARQRVEAASRESAQQVVTQQARQGVSPDQLMERGVVAQENSLKELQTLVKLMSQYLEKNGAGSDTVNAPSSPPSTAENAMNNIPVRSQSEKPAMPFNTRRPGK
jgi:putative chitinase